MASRKLIRDLLITKQPLLQQLMLQRVLRTNTRLGILPAANRFASHRRFSVLSEFSKKIRGEGDGNPDFQRTVKELKDRAEELKGVKEDLKVRTKRTTEQLYKQVDGVWTEAESVAKKLKPQDQLLPEKGIDQRAQAFITRMKAEMLASRSL